MFSKLRGISSVRIMKKLNVINVKGQMSQQGVPSITQDRESSSLGIKHIPKQVTDPSALDSDRDYLITFSNIVEALIQGPVNEIVSDVNQRIAKILIHTVPYGRQFEGHAVVDTYKLIESPVNLTAENLKLANIMSWCHAMVIGSFIIIDDMLDGEEIRKGLPCWHTFDDVGILAVNDSSLLKGILHVTLTKYFSDHHCYLPAMKLFEDACFKTSIGQVIDMACKKSRKPCFTDFTKEKIVEMAKYKSTAMSYKLPVSLAMSLAGKYDHLLHSQVCSILEKIGYIFLVHNDVQDAFGNPEIFGRRRNTDIRNGKCSWLAVEALQRGTPAQRNLFMEHYGESCNESEQIICSLYRELKLSDVYAEFEKKFLKMLYDEADKISDRFPAEVFHNLLTDVTQYREGYCC